MKSSRSLGVCEESIERLCQLSQSEIELGTFEEASALIPQGLCPEEIYSIGDATWDAKGFQEGGFRKGKKLEEDVIFLVGSVTVERGDLVSAQNAAIHLRRNIRTINAFCGAALLNHSIRKETKKRKQALTVPGIVE